MVCVLGNVCDSRVDLEGVINGKYQGETRLRKHAQSCKITTQEAVKWVYVGVGLFQWFLTLAPVKCFAFLVSDYQ